MNEKDKGFESKIVFLGDTGVGKTSLVLRYVEQKFSSNIQPTIGASFLSKIVFAEGVKMKLQLWDTAGQERFRSLAPMYYRGAGAAILIYDVTSEESFLRTQEWVKELKTNIFEDIVLILVGNQIDKGQFQVSSVEASAYAESIGALFYETSAKKNIGVDEMFSGVVKQLNQQRVKQVNELIDDYDTSRFSSTSVSSAKNNSINTCCYS